VKQTFALLAAALVAGGALAGTAAAASPAKQLAALQKDVTALQATVKKQQKSIKLLTNALVGNFYGDACLTAQTSDAFQSTWGAVDQGVGHSIFGPQQTISDRNACSTLQPVIPRQGIRVPPLVTPFSSLIAWLLPTGKALH
jgi:hypothetical protein